jgi:hypothetical protein
VVARDESELRGLVARLTSDFAGGRFDLSGRPGAPASGWDGMPEFRTAEAMRAFGASEPQVRLALTFGSAMDRARDADLLWDRVARLFTAQAWALDPDAVLKRPAHELRDALLREGVSQRHGPDSSAWLAIAAALFDSSSRVVRAAVFDGAGDAPELLRAVREGTRYPLLRGPKVSVMWVRMLAWPGGARITGLEALPVAVDTQVKKVSEYLGVTDTAALPIERAKPIIQAAWRRAGAASAGPEALAGTGAALDPALWFLGKWGCTHCERVGRRLPVSAVCDGCTYRGPRPAPVD